MVKFITNIFLFISVSVLIFCKNYDYKVVKNENNFVIIEIAEEKPKYKSIRKKHTLKEKESLFDIAEKYKITIEEILELNQAKSRKDLKPGQVIYLEK
ncbi:MAG: LysM peptidoglycan-binding domain-containing protein [Cetobacterium sp.]